jgi:hypothetical protein
MSEHAGADRERAAPNEAAAARAGLVHALKDLESGERDSMERLHGALCELVGTLRRAGRSADEVQQEIRAIVSEPATPEGNFRVPAIARAALVELSLQWCAEEYGRADG